MLVKNGLVAGACAGLALLVADLAAQGAPPTSAAPGAQQAQGSQGRGRGATFPAQQRPPGDPAVIARGKTLYSINCSGCHGPDLRGGDIGGPNLLRADVVLNDEHGELIRPIVFGSRAGMPAVDIPEADVIAVAEFIHSVAAMGGNQGRPPAAPPVELNIVVGNVAAGQAYFAAKCTQCHSAAGDLMGIAARIPDPKTLQNFWVGGGGGRGRGGEGEAGGPEGGGRGGRGAAPQGKAGPVTVTVTLPSGQKFEGVLGRIDEFDVTLIQPDGASRTFRRDRDVPKVEVHDPLAPHKKMLPLLADKDMHDVTAYLVTLK